MKKTSGSSEGSKPASGAGPKPASGAGPKPASGAGSIPAQGTGTKPAPAAGTKPAPTANTKPLSSVGSKSASRPASKAAMALALDAALAQSGKVTSAVRGGIKQSKTSDASQLKAVCDGGGASPWDYSSVTDDRSAAVFKCGPPPCIPNGCIKPEQHYACDRELAKALAQFVSLDEREKVLAWLEVLDGMTMDEDELSERSMYMTCLGLLLKSGQLVPPFTRMPPAVRPVKPLRDAVDRHLYKKTQIECRKRRMYKPTQYEQPDRSVAQRPSDFFGHMPTPLNGVICYGATFSFM